MIRQCDCHACELGDPAMCYGCPVHGSWCDRLGEGPNCSVPEVSEPTRLTVAEQLDNTQTGEEFGNVILGLFTQLDKIRNAE